MKALAADVPKIVKAIQDIHINPATAPDNPMFPLHFAVCFADYVLNYRPDVGHLLKRDFIPHYVEYSAALLDKEGIAEVVDEPGPYDAYGTDTEGRMN